MLGGEVFLLLQKSSPFGRAVAVRRLRGFCLLFLKNDQLAEHIVQHDHQYIGKDLHGKAPQCLRIVAAGNEDRRGAVCTADDGNSEIGRASCRERV